MHRRSPPSRKVLLLLVTLASAMVAAQSTPSPGQDPSTVHPEAQPNLFQPGDRVAFLGNTFAERLQLGGHLEAALLASLPDHRLVTRNLAWSADEVALRPRPLNFGTVEEHLRQQAIDVAMLFYGANEAFAGPDGLDDFKVDLERYLDRLTRIRSGDRALRLILVSPIPHERHELFSRLPDPEARNQTLALYSRAIHAIAIERGIPYLDIFSVTQQAFDREASPLTINSVHLNDRGERIVSAILVRALGLADPGSLELQRSPNGDLNASQLPTASRVKARLNDSGEGGTAGQIALVEAGETIATGSTESWQAGIELSSSALEQAAETLRRTVVEKNRLFFDRYRAVNGYYIYGERRRPFGVDSFPPEMKRFDEQVAELDQRLHELSRVPSPLPFELVVEGGE